MLNQLAFNLRRCLENPERILPSVRMRLISTYNSAQERRYSSQARNALAQLDARNVRSARVVQLAELFEISTERVRSFESDLKRDREFAARLAERREEIRAAAAGTGTSDWIDCETIYLVTRILRPKVVVETGVQFGATSAYILLGMYHNATGYLHSIDLPWPGLPGLDQPLGIGYLVPNDLRSRWQLTLGDSKSVLPELLKMVRGVDMFNHDSVHTPEFMTWEYRTVWPYLGRGGVLASHDIRRHTAFQDYCKRNSADFTLIYNQGIARKPR